MIKIQQNAEKDLQNASAHVQSATDKKDSLRKKLAELKKNHDDLQNKLKNEYDTLKLASAYSNHGKENLNHVLSQEKLSEADAENAAKRKKNAEDHLRSVKEAIQKNEQLQSQQRN
ncbi:MAG: hypothetical protein ACHQF0_14665 [Chitinophagales bacterium]